MTGCLGIGVGLTDVSVLGGAGRPVIALEFAAAAFPTSEMSFSRATDRAASVTDFEGVLWKAKANEMRLAGLRRVENLFASTAVLGTQSVTMSPLVRYVVSFEGTGSIAFSGAAGGSLSGDGVTRVSTSFVAVSSSLTATVTGSVLNAQVEAVPAAVTTPSEYVSNGVLSTPFHGFFADGVKYFATDRSGATISNATRLGMVMEGSATNSLLRSEEYDNASWAKTDTTITANTFTAPDGTTTGDLLTEGVAGTARCSQNITITAGSTYAHSVYLRRGNHDWVRVALYDSTAAAGIEAYFNLGTGAAGSAVNVGVGSGAAAAIVNIGGGWYRCTVAGAVNGGFTAATAHTFSATADLNPARVNNATRGQWGSQLENSNFTSSYIATVAATVTRPADIFFITSASSNPTAVSMFADVFLGPGIIANPTPVTYSDGSLNNAFSIGGYGGGVGFQSRVDSGGANQALANTALTLANARWKVAMAAQANDFVSYINGVLAMSDAAGTMPIGITRLTAGANQTALGGLLNGTVRSVKLYLRRVSNAELAAMTA